MKITEINIIPIKPNGGLIGFASVVLDNGLYLGSMGVYSRLDGTGYRITYPTKKVGDKDLNIYHPISRELGIAIEDAITGKALELFG
ncbi:MAG TPA: septation protein SpoVG family protein [Candidatus Paceibacterota bacterium]|nr:septation protein SpoVG family protein [Candidatus Paceibacterota bacterium]